MSRNGNGTYNLPAGNPVVTGTTISSTWANNTLADMANAITGSIAADGQTPITGALKGTNGTVAFAGVGQTKIPSGTTAQRAASPTDGMIRYNTDLKQYEGYKEGAWSIFGNGAGGTLFSDTVTATQGQTVIVLTTGYVLGGDNLSVYVNGSRQIYNVNYTETTTTSFTFTNGLNAGDLVNYTIGASTSLSVNASSVLYNEGSTGAVDTNVKAKLQESVSVKDFGAIGNGIADDTAAIQAAINSKNGFLSVYFPAGVYKVTSQITLAYDRYELHGDGVATRILFMPTADAACFVFDRTNQNSVQNTVRDLAFYSDDTGFTKTAIKLYSISSCLFENIQTVSPHWEGGTGSIFLHILGREGTAIRGLNVQADKPILISPIPSAYNPSGIGIDHFHFSDCYLIASGNYPIVTIEDGVYVTQLTFDGYQAWVGGTYGVYWNDTTSAQISSGIVFANIRMEQGLDATKQAFYINHNYSVAGFTVRNSYIGDRAGLYLRKVSSVTIDNSYFTAIPQEVLNIDGSNDNISINNCFWQAGTTSTITGLRTIYSTPEGYATPINAFYIKSTSTFIAEIHEGIITGEPFTVANAGVVSLLPTALSPSIYVAIVTTNEGTNAIFSINGNQHLTYLISDPSGIFSTTKGTASKINIYWDATSGTYQLENLRGSSYTYNILKLS